MVPNKFEEYIRKQLEEREIQPSSDAWLKLSERLDKTAIEQPQKRGYFWYAVAACLIGLIVLSVVVFDVANTSRESSIQVVEEELRAIDPVEVDQIIEAQRNAVELVSTASAPEEISEGQVEKVKVTVTEKEEFAGQWVDTSNEIQVPLNASSEKFINMKVLEVVAQVDALEQDNEMLTDTEVDSLLRRAQEEILTAKLFRSDHSVDAMALLSEVEKELDKSFRDQIFESLKSGFLKVRTAVADRNN